MKRCISVLLSMAMVLSLAGCTQKETRTTRQTTKDDETEVTETEDTETSATTTEASSETSETEGSTTESSATSESSESSETTESETSATETSESTEPSETTQSKPIDPAHPEFTHDLTTVALSNQAIDRGYGELMPGRKSEVARLTEHCDMYSITDQKYSKMNEKLEEIYGALKKKYDEEYDTRLSSFADTVKAIPDGNEWIWEHMEIDSRTYVSRSDSKVLSFNVDSYTHFGYDWKSDGAYYNFDPVTAEPIKLESIVTDRQALADVVLSFRISTDSDYYDEDDAAYNDVLTTLSERIHTGDLSTIDFGLTQNDLYLYQEGDSAGELSEYRCIISALDCGGCLDLSYFTATPEYYTLSSDFRFQIAWDFDEDGDIDTLRVANECSNYHRVDLKVYYNDKALPCEDYYDSEVTSIMDYYVIHNDDGFSLYIEFSKQDTPVSPLHIFRLNDGKVEYVGPFGEFDAYPYDPTSVRLQQRSDLLGTGDMVLTCSLTGDEGFPKEISFFYEKDEIVVTKKDMSIPQTDADGNPNGQTVTIPAGTTVRYFGVDTVNQRAFFSTLNKNEAENIEFTMPVSRFSHGIDYEIDLNGETSADLFVGMNYF